MEVPLQLMDLLGQDMLLCPGQVPATPQLSHFLPEPFILQHKLLQHPIEAPLGPGFPGPMEPWCLGLHLIQLEPQVTILLLELQQLSLRLLGRLYSRGLGTLWSRGDPLSSACISQGAESLREALG